MTDIIKLSDNQLKVLTAAADCEDGAARMPEKMKAAAAGKVAQALIERKLMREVRAKPGMPVWRRDGEARCFSLVILSAGRKALEMQAASDPEKADPGQQGHREERALGMAVESGAADPGASSPNPNAPAKPHSTRATKKSEIIALLQRPEGASLDALTGATGWLPHTTRAALTGLRKSGFEIERRQEEEQGSIYRIVMLASSKAS